MMAGKRMKLVIGIDFGTTFSGICWGLEGSEEVEVIKEWPGNGNITSQKVPTVLAYHNDVAMWGYQVNDIKQGVRAFKLLLDESKDVKFRPAVESQILIQQMSSSPVRVAGEYLKKIVSHAKSILGRRLLGSLMNSMDMQYILTVPPVWSDKAKDLTMQAAGLAGIPQNNLYLLSEPEAAAVYTIRAIQPNSIAIGDAFIVCDAGGGTVYLITYRITQTDPVRMEEVVEGTGRVCGSVQSDDEFDVYLSQAIGEQRYSALSNENKRHALRRWQVDIKPSYSGPDTDELLNSGFAVPVPGVPDTGDGRIFQGMLHMENADVQQIFDLVVMKIETLVSNQQNKAILAGFPPKAILLVGGFGASSYLYKRLKQEFSELEIMQPMDAWSAVVRGAVYRELEGNQVLNRKARCHYGVEFYREYDAKSDKGKNRSWCPYEERWNVHGNVRWYIHKGRSFSEGKPVKFPFYRIVPEGFPFEFCETLKVCGLENAPNFNNNDVAKHCDLSVDLTKVSKELFDKETNSDGIKYYRVNYEILLVPQSACLIFEVQMNAISYGTVRARYY